MQNFSDLVAQANIINMLNARLTSILPPQLKSIKIVNIKEGEALVLVENAAMLQFVKSIDLVQIINQVEGRVKSVIFEVKR